MTSLALVGVGSLAAGLLVTPAAMEVARRTGVVDHPGPLKPQAAAVPYLGGVAVFAAVVVGAAATRAVVLVPLALALALGVLDDTVHLSPWTRLGAQLVIGGVIAAVTTTRLGGVGGPVLVVVVTVLLMNGVNMLDGVDGLTGALVAVAGGAFAWLVPGEARDLGLALAAGLLGFLWFNRPPARVYLGDGGTYLLGATLTVLLATAWAPHVRASLGVACLVLVAAPAAEVVFAVVRRLRAGQSPLSGDRGHPYDRLVAAGVPTLAVSTLYAAVEVTLAAVALAASGSRTVLPAVVAVAAVAAVLVGAAATTGVLAPHEGSRP